MLEFFTRHVPSIALLLEGVVPAWQISFEWECPEEKEVCCLYGVNGVGLGCIAKKWLEKSSSRFLYLIEDCPRALRAFADQGEARDLLAHPRCHLFFLETPLAFSLIAKKIAWGSLLLSLHIQSLPGRVLSSLSGIEECHIAAQLLLSETADFGIESFCNAWKNGGFMKSLSSLKGVLKNIPAIICGAGASFAEIQKVQGLEQRACIFAGGSALLALSGMGIEPHFGCLIDRSSSLDLVLESTFSEIPSLIQRRIEPLSFSLLHGERIHLPERGALRWEEWESLELEGPSSLGWTVTNALSQIALWMGCNPIVFVGMDLCDREGKKYSWDEGSRKDSSIAILQEGEEIFTQTDWWMAARFTEDLAKAHPETRFIQTAEKGLFLNPPVERLSFQTLCEEFFHQRDIRGIVFSAVQRSSEISFGNNQSKREWIESIHRCLSLCKSSSSEWSGEPVYRFYLEPLWQIWAPLFEREAVGHDLERHRLLFFEQVLYAFLNGDALQTDQYFLYDSRS